MALAFDERLRFVNQLPPSLHIVRDMLGAMDVFTLSPLALAIHIIHFKLQMPVHLWPCKIDQPRAVSI